MIYQYPSSDLDRPRQLLSVLGSFWNDVYAGKDQIYAYAEASAQSAQQTMLDMLELLQAVSRYEVPIFHKENWYALRLLQSASLNAPTNQLRYDGSEVYGKGGLQYDMVRDSGTFAYPLPAGLVGSKLILNRLTEPSLILHAGSDYTLDTEQQVIIFREDPFADTRVPRVPVYREGVVADQEALLWVFRGDFDWDTVYKQFGYVLNMRMKSSRGYRDLLNVVFDALVAGCSAHQVSLGMAAITGIPLVLEQTETVEAVTLDEYNLLVITDAHVYKFAKSAIATVAVGDVVRAGDPLTDALSIVEFNQGMTPAWLQAIALGPGMLAACFYMDLLFENKSFPLEVITNDPSGFTKLQFPLGGYPLDAEHFFNELHSRGVAASLRPLGECDSVPTIIWEHGVLGDATSAQVTLRRGTLAHLLDVRANAVNEPKAPNLPTTINPLQFLVQNVLRFNTFLVRVKASLLGTGAAGLDQIRWLRRLCPPQTAMILLVELTPQTETISPDQVVDSLLPIFYGMGPLLETISDQIGERVTLRVISGTCQ